MHVRIQVLHVYIFVYNRTHVRIHIHVRPYVRIRSCTYALIHACRYTRRNACKHNDCGIYRLYVRTCVMRCENAFTSNVRVYRIYRRLQRTYVCNESACTYVIHTRVYICIYARTYALHVRIHIHVRPGCPYLKHGTYLRTHVGICVCTCLACNDCAYLHVSYVLQVRMRMNVSYVRSRVYDITYVSHVTYLA
jgi:hypothetical protein